MTKWLALYLHLTIIKSRMIPKIPSIMFIVTSLPRVVHFLSEKHSPGHSLTRQLWRPVPQQAPAIKCRRFLTNRRHHFGISATAGTEVLRGAGDSLSYAQTTDISDISPRQSKAHETTEPRYTQKASSKVPTHRPWFPLRQTSNSDQRLRSGQRARPIFDTLQKRLTLFDWKFSNFWLKDATSKPMNT